MWVDRRGYGLEYETRHNLPYCRNLLDLLEGAQFIWRPFNDELIAGLPDYCSNDRIMWSSFISLMYLDIVEHHATERVLRQFGHPQLVPPPPIWHMTHYRRDDHFRVDQTYVAWLEEQIDIWDQRHDLIPPPPPPDRTDGEHEYMGWYRSVT
nr:serine/threonine-protein phosphatase 7 long form homolog [Nicotiana tomentosiformis]XP_033509012.1 serine/threonine-protein phosphatase 7 long form homolog [Nicotiana tomentosiformis]